MSTVTVYTGLDYHQDSIQVCVMDASNKVLANRRLPNHTGAVVAMVAAYGNDVRAAIESCPGAAKLADELATHHKWSISLAHPGYVARMKLSLDKSDKADAYVLADLIRVGYLPKVWLAPEEIRQLRTLVRYRQQLTNERRATKLRITALLRNARVKCGAKMKRWSLTWTAWLKTAEGLGAEGRWVVDRHLEDLKRIEQAITAVESRLTEVTREDPVVAQLHGHKGIGDVTAWTLRAEIGRFDRFNTGKQLARFCGLSPRNASSGQRQADAGLIKAGNPQLRAIIIEAAHRLIRYNPRWNVMALAMQGRGKPTCLTAAAVANRWIRWLYHQMTAPPTTAAAPPEP